MNEVGPRKLAKVEKIESLFQSTFKSFGFQKISLPIVESTDLFLKILGDRVKSQMILFKDHEDHELCFRPEMTTSTIRYFLTHHKYENFPLKFCYSGKVFRYQSDHEKECEYYHLGTEVIGVEDVLSDAESIALACTCLENLGIDKYKVTIGNVGIVTHLVDHLDVDGAFKNFFLENLRMKKKDHLYKVVKEGFFAPEPESDYRDLLTILKKLSSEEEKTLLLKLLNLIHPHFSEELEEAEDVVEGILDKIKRQNQYESIHHILEFSEKLQSICGSPKEAIKDATSLLTGSHIDLKYIYDLDKVTQFLIDYGIAEEKITIDFGLGRNLQYYTGIVFEINYPDMTESICGGGRYDDLIKTLGYDKPLSGCGFTFDLDQVCNILMEKEEQDHLFQKNMIDLYFIVLGSENASFIFPIIRQLREKGMNIYSDFSTGSLKEKYENLLNQGISSVAIFGDEKTKNHVRLKDLENNKEETLTLDELLARFKK